MPDPNDFLGTGVWGDEYRDLGGIVVPDFLRQQQDEQEMRQAAYDRAMGNLYAQQEQEAAVARARAQEEAGANFVDWPTYQQIVSNKLKPREAFEEYVQVALPEQFRQMGYSPEEAQAEIEQFLKLVPMPGADYGFLGNLYESLKSGGRAGARGVEAASTEDPGRLAELAVASAGDEPVGPRTEFDRLRRTDDTSMWESIKQYLSAASSQKEGFANELVYQFAQSAPVMAAGLAALFVPLPGAAPTATFASSYGLDMGAEVLGAIADEAQARGIKPNDANAIRAMLQEPGVYERLSAQAQAHGVGVASFDAAMAAISLGIGGAALRAARAGRPLRVAGLGAGEVAASALTGGAGEAAGQALAGRQLSPDDIVAEALGGFFSDVPMAGAGALRERIRNPLQRPGPVAPPTLTDVQDDFGDTDMAAFGEPEPGASPDELLRAAVMQRMARPGMEVVEGGPREEITIPPVGGIEEITIPPAPFPSEEITVPPVETPPTYDVTELPFGTPEQGAAQGTPVVEEITISSPARMAQEAERTILRIAKEMQQASLAESPALDLEDPSNVNQWLADRGVVLRSKEQMDAIASVLAAPKGQRQAAIADVIDWLGLSREKGAESLTQALLAMSRSIPPDKADVITLDQGQQNLARELGVNPELARKIAIDAVAQDVMAAIESGVTDAPSTASVAAPAPKPVAGAPRVTRRGLKRGESIPTLGSLNPLAGRRQSASRPSRTEVEPGGGVRAGDDQAGTAAGGDAGGTRAAAAGRPGSARVEPSNTGSAQPVPRLVAGKRYGASTPKPALPRQAAIDVVTMDKEEYEKTYPGRNWDDDVEGIVSADYQGMPGERQELTNDRMIAMQHESASQVLNWIASVSKNPIHRVVARELAQLNLPTIFRLRRFSGSAGAKYAYMERADGTPELDAVLLDPYNAGARTIEVLLHEYIHAATLNSYLHPKTEQQRQAARQMDALYVFVREQMPDSTEYGFFNTTEFISEALSNPDFQRLLNTIQVPELEVSVWTAFKELVLRLLGKVVTKGSALHAALNRVEGLFTATTGNVFSNATANIETAKKVRNSGAPSTAMVGTKDGRRTFIAYRKSKTDPDSPFTLYATTAEQPRGDPATKVVGLTREQAEQMIRDAGSEVIPPVADVVRSAATPTNTEKRLVGYDGQDLRAAAFQQKDGTWTYYESNEDVRTDPHAKVYKGLSKDQVQRYINEKGYATEAPTPGAVRPNATTKTTVGYDPSSSLRRSYQDREATLKNIGGDIEIMATLRNSRYENTWRKNWRQYVEPARLAGLRLMESYGKTQAQIETDLKDLHVVERMQNKMKAVLRGNMDDTTRAKTIKRMRADQSAAQSRIDAIQASNPGYLRQLRQDFAPKVKAMADQTIDLRVQYGLLSREVGEAIKAAYDYYVPLQKGDRTTSAKGATGTNVDTDKTFARMIEQMQRSIASGEFNRLKLAVVDLPGLINNETGVSPIGPGTTHKLRYNPETNTIDEGVDNHVFDDNAIDVYRQGVRERYVVNDESLLDAVKPIKGEERKLALTALAGWWARINHMIAVGKTTLNPAFGPMNFFRDVGTANINVPRGVSRVKFNVNLMDPRTYAAVAHNVVREAFGADPVGTYADAREAGSFISHRNYLGLDKTANETYSMFQPDTWDKAKHGASRLFDFFATWSQFFESVPRYAMYKAAKESGRELGLTGQKLEDFAGFAAKTASVNFENRGKKNLSNYWIFGNAKAQGLAAIINTAQKKGLSPTVVAATAGMIALGALASGLGHEWSEKDKDGKSLYDKIPNYRKDSLVLFQENAKGVPIPQEVAPFYVLGNAIMDANIGATKSTEAAARVFSSFLNNLWPGNVPQQEVAGHKARPWEFMMRAVLPSQIMPAMDLATNHNTFGNELVRNKDERLARGTPLYAMGSANENQLAVNLAKGLYEKTGIDTAPQQWKLVHNYFNPLAEGYAFIRDVTTDREPKYRGEVVDPLARRFTGAATPFYDQEQFDELLAKSTQADYQANKRGINNLTPEEQALARSADTLRKVQSDIKQMFKGSNALTAGRRALLQERARDRMLEGIRRYNELRDRMVRKGD